ncbi:MAG TPA: helix-turn-helix transcriptional regulator [Ferruginibacter sp.]|nr:helix-turn-helix transcriptional regulator [Ferruginibacter sp.]
MNLEKEEFIRKLGLNIRDEREKKGLSLEALAFKAGIDYSQLSRIENGKINTSVFSIYNIALGLEIPITQLFLF